MNPNCRELLFSDGMEPTEFRSALQANFGEIGNLSGAACGVLVLRSEDGDGFEQIASFGYPPEGFFYSFLARGQGSFEAMEESSVAMEFPSGDFELFLPDSEVALCSRITNGSKMFGFILWEFERHVAPSDTILCTLVARRIAQGLSESPLTRNQSLPGNHPGIPKSTVVQFMEKYSPDFASQLSRFRETRVLLLLGPEGAGKKSLAKWIARFIESKGRCLIVSEIPQKQSLLEKSLMNWMDIAENGVLVLECKQDLGLPAERTFWEKISENDSVHFIFTSERDFNTDGYSPFRKLLGEGLELPELDSLNLAQKREILTEYFSELTGKMDRQEMRLSGDCTETLVQRKLPRNFLDLNGLFGEAILNANQTEISLEDIERARPETPVSPDEESLDLRSAVEALERQKILQASRIFAGNQIRMAKALGISRGSLQYKLKQLGI